MNSDIPGQINAINELVKQMPPTPLAPPNPTVTLADRVTTTREFLIDSATGGADTVRITSVWERLTGEALTPDQIREQAHDEAEAVRDAAKYLRGGM